MTWTASISGGGGMTGESDAILRLRNGDLDCLSELIPLYQNRLYRYLVRLVADTSLADDLFQETWLRASENIRRYDPSRSFDHWIFSIAHNLAIDQLRRRKPEALVEEATAASEANGGTLERLLDAERASALSDAISELPAAYREILALRFDEEMKLEEIARVTGAPLGTVKTRLQRALEKLRRRF